MQLSVPSLFWYEVANTLRYGSQRRLGEAGPAETPWHLLRGVPIHTIDFAVEAFPFIADLATRQDITVYDAAYVFLAQSLQVPLITSDARLVERCANLPFVWLLEAL